MGEVIQFVSKSERERIRLIRQARALYESVFPSANPAGAQRDDAAATPAPGGINARRGDGVLA
jgi:hypothetical protein